MASTISNSKRLRLLSAFKKWDKDGDGFINEDELRQVLLAVGGKADQTGDIIRVADKNKDGKLDYEEFLAWIFSGKDDASKVCKAATAIVWPKDASARLVPAVGGATQHPETLRLDAPVPCQEVDVAYWTAGGPGKVRVRVLEDGGVLKLGSEYTVGIRFRVSRGSGSRYDTLLMGHDSLHWLAVEQAERRICCASGKTGETSSLDYIVPCDEWIVCFLQPKGAKTAVFVGDTEGLLEVGCFDISLTGSKLDKLGWADNEVQIADVLLWNRCLSWSEMASSAPRAPLPERPKDTSALEKPRPTFRGQVVDLSGQGLKDVKVSWGKDSCSTDEDGYFAGSFSDAETDVPDDDGRSCSAGSASSVASTVLSFSCEHFAPATARLQCCTGGQETSLQVTLREVSASEIIDVSLGGSVVDEKTGSSLTVPPNALVYLDGSPVEGCVTVSLSVIDVTDPAALASMPGDFSAVGEDGSSVFLQSLGAAWVGASDDNGVALTVREDCEGVTLDLKSSAIADANKLGTDAELWTFNDSSGKWELQQQSLLKVNGETAPNSAARVSLSAEEKPKKYYGKKRGPRYKYENEDDDVGSTRMIEGCMSPDAFRAAVNTPGKKALTTDLKKLGYINCDLAYHHPQRAVMLTGKVTDGAGKALEGIQLWSVGRDYRGRCPDVAKEGGKFGAMIAQFDSEVDVEVHISKIAEGDDKVEVYYEHQRYPKLSEKGLELIRRTVGKYSKDEKEEKVWAKKNAKDSKAPDVQMLWNEKRRQWQNIVGEQVVFVKDTDGSDTDGPFGGAWRPVAAAFSDASDAEKAYAPGFNRSNYIEKQTFGPFKTGPPGEFVDVGELVVK
eukprot:TRINITY_DN8907_c1_g5_i1.p1 TRINITY_DN8907_c1_g5~~TRINITY_DN8907_c1_g5_i1.p1  ORF type:complete len:842 (+),score=156.39 TRINITY_DN8907_c1_g5_i1:35-2560(+)